MNGLTDGQTGRQTDVRQKKRSEKLTRAFSSGVLKNYQTQTNLITSVYATASKIEIHIRISANNIC